MSLVAEPTDCHSAYLLTTCAFQLLFGKLYTFFSIKVVYLSAIFIFEIGSVVCGAAPNSIALIIGRAIAGVGSAGIFSGALVIIAYAVPLVKRPIFTGIVRHKPFHRCPHTLDLFIGRYFGGVHDSDDASCLITSSVDLSKILLTSTCADRRNVRTRL